MEEFEELLGEKIEIINPNSNPFMLPDSKLTPEVLIVSDICYSRLFGEIKTLSPGTSYTIGHLLYVDDGNMILKLRTERCITPQLVSFQICNSQSYLFPYLSKLTNEEIMKKLMIAPHVLIGWAQRVLKLLQKSRFLKALQMLPPLGGGHEGGELYKKWKAEFEQR